MSGARSRINIAAMQGRSWIEANLNRRGFGKGFCGACAWASTYILCRLHDEGINSYVAISKIPGGQHAFVVTRNYIIDVTATQFKLDVDKFLPEVIVMSRRKELEFFWMDVVKKLKTPEAVVAFTKEPRWPDDQIPNLKYIKERYENF